MLNTHYSGRFKDFIEKINGKAPKKFYEIFNSHNFYDVSDVNNSLTPEQRASVRTENQNRYSDFSQAIADMFAWYLGDEDEGVITNSVQGVVDKLDVRSSANAAKTDAIGNGISTLAQGPLVPLQAINPAQQIAGSQVAAVMGTNIFDPDLIPPIGFGMNFSLPGNIANIYKPGFFQPNWDFLYDFEFKSSKFYYTGTGGLKVGTGIDVGAAPSELYLKQIFDVASVSKDLTPLGDPVGGITEDDYNVILKAKNYGINTGNSGLSNTDIKTFSLSDIQIRSCFYKLVDLNLWKPINNRTNWVNGHWGALGHNSCPDYVRTAVASFIWDTGMTLVQNKSDEAALISYCLQMGIYYLTGFKYKVNMTGISSDIDILLSGIIAEGQNEVVTGLPKNKNVANRYFTWIADILVRTTHNINGDTIALDKRKRRIAEANLIYKGVGLPTILFGKPVDQLDYAHTITGLKSRSFDKLSSAIVYRYANEGAPGGSGPNHSLQGSSVNDVNIQYGAEVNTSLISDYTIRVVKSIFSQAGITSILVTSAARTPKEQARVMFENLEKGRRISYKAPGQAVEQVYDTEKASGTNSNQIKTDMETKISSFPSGSVSRHTIDPVIYNVLDIAPNALRPANKTQILEQVLAANTGVNQFLDQFLGPRPNLGNDPAYHLSIPQSSNGDIQPLDNALPDVPFTLSSNTNFKTEIAWMAPLAKDKLLQDDFSQLNS